MKKEKHNKLNDTINLEEFLLENNFELDTYYGTNKKIGRASCRERV